jgi:hypothetical protein
MDIIWTGHARDRQKEWHKQLGVTEEEVEELLRNPAQVVPGDRNVLVAQARRGTGLLRVPFVDAGGSRKVVTIYWTSRVEKYWKG